jgi:hypothetical protein
MVLEEVRSDVAGAKNKIRFLTARTIRLRHLSSSADGIS